MMLPSFQQAKLLLLYALLYLNREVVNICWFFQRYGLWEVWVCWIILSTSYQHCG